MSLCFLKCTVRYIPQTCLAAPSQLALCWSLRKNAPHYSGHFPRLNILMYCLNPTNFLCLPYPQWDAPNTWGSGTLEMWLVQIQMYSMCITLDCEHLYTKWTENTSNIFLSPCRNVTSLDNWVKRAILLQFIPLTFSVGLVEKDKSHTGLTWYCYGERWPL